MPYPIAKHIIPPIYKIWLGKVEGLKNLPKKGPYILAQNHCSYYDILLMGVVLIPRLNIHIHTLVNSRYWSNPFTSAFLDWAKAIPVYVGEQHDKKKNNAALQKAEHVLRKGGVVQIFPEGTRSFDGKIRQGKSGAARLALTTGSPIVPIGILNSHHVLPKGAILPRFTKAQIRIGKPIPFKRIKNPSKKQLEDATKTVMKKIAALAGQRYLY